MTASRYLTAYEHQTLSIDDPGDEFSLTSAEAEYLVGLGEVRKGFVKRGHRSIKLAQHCGLLNLGNRILEILPKTDDAAPPEACRGVVLRLLSEAKGFPVSKHLHAGQHLRPERLLEVFIAAFFDEVAEIVRGGLLRRYKEHDEDLQVVRGRIVASRQFAVHSNRPDLIACQYDDLTADNIWNRLLKAGLRAVRPWLTSGELHRRWVELMAVFEEAGDAGADIRALKRLVFDRQAKRYEAAIDWVRWILSLLSPALRAGDNAAPGLLFDMNLLFQSAVASVLRRRAPSDVEIHSQEADRYLATVTDSGQRAFKLKPDLVIRRNGRVVAIGDSKWKRIELSGSGHLMPDEGDMYQMHAYAVSYGCGDLTLIYPWHSGLIGSKETTFELASGGSVRPTVNVLCVDLKTSEFPPVRGRSAPEFGRLLAQRADLTSETLNPVYSETQFRADRPWDHWPAEFAIITAHNPGGNTLDDAGNDASDEKLRSELRRPSRWIQRLVGYSPTGAHAEAGWAVELQFDEACDVALRFGQDAIYYIVGDTLYVSHCDVRRRKVRVGPFRARVSFRN